MASTSPPGEELHADGVEAADFRSLWRRKSKARMAQPPPAPVGLTAHDGLAVDAGRDTLATRRLMQDEKVEKHRMIVRRLYYQKKELQAKLRDEIAKLEAQYQQLVGETTQLELLHGNQHHSAHATEEKSSISRSREAHCGTCAQLNHLRRQYRELSVTKESLQKEREALEDSLHEHHAFQDRVDKLVHQEATRRESSGLPTSSAASEAVGSPTDSAITLHTAEFQVSFQRLTEQECVMISHAALQKATSQTSSPAFQDVGSHRIMGWNRKRIFGTRPANFSLLKSFPRQSAATLWQRTWLLYTGSRLFEELYSGTVNMKFHILQRVSGDFVVFARTLKTEKLKVRNLTFFLLARVQVENKHYVLFQSIDKQRIHAVDHPDDAVLSMFSWLSFTDRKVDDQTQCDLEFSGVLPSASVADTDFWMMEFVSYLLRLETRAIGPVFHVRSDTNGSSATSPDAGAVVLSTSQLV